MESIMMDDKSVEKIENINFETTTVDDKSAEKLEIYTSEKLEIYTSEKLEIYTLEKIENIKLSYNNKPETNWGIDLEIKTDLFTYCISNYNPLRTCMRSGITMYANNKFLLKTLISDWQIVDCYYGDGEDDDYNDDYCIKSAPTKFYANIFDELIGLTITKIIVFIKNKSLELITNDYIKIIINICKQPCNMCPTRNESKTELKIRDMIFN